METELVEAPSLWNTKQSDITVGDSMKIALVATAAAVVIPIVIYTVIVVPVVLVQKFKDRKKTKLEIVDNTNSSN